MSALDLHRLGLGTWQNDDPDQCAASVRTALELGYRNIDTAQGYDNEEDVGRGIAEADVPREEVFLATKVDTDSLAHDDVLDSTAESLDKLGTDYVDLLYVHWPTNTYDAEGTLSAFDELYDQGKIRHVGVSNFEPRHLDEAREILEAPLFANQVEMHPYLQQTELREYAADHGHHVVAYSPLARTKVLDDPVLEDVAEKHDATIPQVTLAWFLALDNVTAIPKATSEEHIRANWGAYDVDLDEEDLDRIAELDRGHREVDFEGAPWNQ
ncbi:2,5-diketo-D-gluconate reductase B [Halomicrobium zhouii]|uniref:2,5-diketo-D-gluconate reductase B n=1 Tax=Halomicrobium zhouii TaxID=767519 RepID=A0A1I6M8P8_9EURY|nr:aldo/keto reductase [Halomicrobium zhouii]SFS12084.1 2,5-diketo-D-gluconate reductase B [Halomicrobium zhouii]